jgi:hypothetical protein
MLRLALLTAGVAVGTVAAAADPPPDPTAALTAGSRWKGVVRERKAGTERTADVLLVVTKRDGAAFEGTYENLGGSNVFAVEGTAEKGKVAFQFTRVEKGAGAKNIIGVKVRGVIAPDPKTKRSTLTATYDWPDAQNPKVVARGAVTLTLAE